MQLLEFQLALTFIDGVGDVLAKNLITYCGGADQVFKQKKTKLLKIPGIGLKAAENIASFNDFKRVERELRFIEKHQIKPLFYLDEEYPNRLKQFADSPILLYYKGKADLNNPKIVGIVGTRKATEYGKQFINELCEALSPTGAIVLSGLAYGIDIHAHKQALTNNLPTIGVMAHGLDRLYPPKHISISKKMVEKGGLLTEFPSETNPDRENFPKRNRIVAGLCDVLVVVETAEKGGAMITADIADSYNKDIMALPGRIYDEMSKGCNKLIRQNKAAIINKPQDLFELMNWDEAIELPPVLQPQLFDLPDTDLYVVNYIRRKVRIGIDEMSIDLNMDPGILSLRLLDLEFRNIIRTLPGKYFELTK